MRRFTLVLVLGSLGAACGDGSDNSGEAGDGDAQGDGDATSGGGSGDDGSGVGGSIDVPPDQAPRGVVNVVGVSQTAGEVTYSLTGIPSASSGTATVACLYHPNGSQGAGAPEIEVFGGYAGERSSVYLRLGGDYVSTGTHDYSFGSATADDLSLRARLTLEDPDAFYEYTVGVSGTKQTTCALTIDEVEQYVSGVVSCRDLIPTQDSLDWLTTSGVLASITLDFSCPLSAEDPIPVPGSGGSPGTGGSSSGGAGTGGGGETGTGGVLIGGGECTGSATPCSLLGSVTCESSQGCTWEEDCEGFSTGCYSQFTQYSCNSQQGCYWSTLYDDCSGSAWSCTLMSGSSSCISQDGCSWEDECTGVASPCSVMTTQSACISQPGCAWTP